MGSRSFRKRERERERERDATTTELPLDVVYYFKVTALPNVVLRKTI